MITDFMIDHFNGIMNTLILTLIFLLVYMFSITDIQQGFYEFKQMVQTFMKIPELFDVLGKTKL